MPGSSTWDDLVTYDLRESGIVFACVTGALRSFSMDRYKYNPGEQAACYRSTTHATRHKLRAHTHSPRTGHIPLSQSPSRCHQLPDPHHNNYWPTQGNNRLELQAGNLLFEHWPVRDVRGNLVCLLHRSESPHSQVHFSSRYFLPSR